MSTWRILRGEGDKAMLYGVLVKILTPLGGSGHDPVRLELVRAARGWGATRWSGGCGSVGYSGFAL